MHYLMLNRTDQNSLLSKLQAMPDFLEASFGTVSPLEAATPGPNGAFSPVEHCWHLADLEREGYAVRIRRLLEEDNPGLPDFDGTRRGEQEGVGAIVLCDIPAMMGEHDASHREEIEEWKRARHDG